MRRAKKIVQKLQKEHTLVHQADGNVCPRLACEKGETLKFSYPSTPLPRGGKKVA